MDEKDRLVDFFEGPSSPPPGPPTPPPEPRVVVTVEQARQMYELGIKQRADGKFGFKKKCHKKGCDKLVEDTCYCEDTVEAAIREVKRRSAYHHDRECWLSDAKWWDGEDIEEGLEDDPVMKDVRLALGISDEEPPETASDEEYGAWEDRYAKWPKRLREKDPALYGRVQEAYIEFLQENGDYDPDDAECGCEA